jgi:uncharacterized cupredoxin-like copper-binding protein
MAGFAGVQAQTSQDLIELTAPTAIQDIALAGPGVDRHPPLATQYAGLTRYGVDRHPQLATQYADLERYGVDRHPPLATQYAGLTRYGVDRHPPLATQYAGLTRYGVDRHPPLATQYAELTGPEPIQVVLQFGTETRNFALTPETLRFEKGKLYKLVIVNPSKTAHFVSAPEFGATIDSISLTQGVALRQGDQQVWYFVADQAGTYDIMCGHKAHADAGMTGKIIVG